MTPHAVATHRRCCSRARWARAHGVLAASSLLVLAPFLAAAAWAFAPQEGGGIRGAGIWGVAATVNGDPITRHELEKELREEMAHQQVAGEDRAAFAREVRAQLLEQLIIHRLLLQQCDRHKIEISPEQLSSFIQEKMSEMRRSGREVRSEEDYMRIALASTGGTEEELRERFRERLRISALLFRRVYREEYISPKQLRAYYDEHPDLFRSEAHYVFRVLLIPTNTPDIGKILETVQARIDAGDSFEQLVEEYGVPSMRGEHAVFRINDTSLDDFERPIPQVVRGLEVGQVSPRIDYKANVRYIRLEERTSGVVLEFRTQEAQSRIRDHINRERQDKQYARYVRELVEGAQIRRFLER